MGRVIHSITRDAAVMLNEQIFQKLKNQRIPPGKNSFIQDSSRIKYYGQYLRLSFDENKVDQK